MLTGAPGVALKVVDGTLRIRSSRTAHRYLGEHPPVLKDPEGFIDTGDVLELRDGRCYFQGRRDGVINVGGLKVHPEEVEAVINADRRVSLHEFVVLTLVRAQLAPPARPGAPKRGTIAEMKTHALVVLGLIAHAGQTAGPEGERGLEAAFRAGAAEMGLAGAAPVGREALTLDAATAALAALKTLAPMQTAVLVKGLFAAVSADGTIRVMEAELMRLVGAVLDCPLPPLLEQLDPATLG